MRALLTLCALTVACTATAFAGDYSAATAPAMKADEDVEAFNQAFVVQYYAIPQSEVVQLRCQGYSWDQIYMMANAAVVTHQPIQQIANLRSQGMSWADIAAKYNVSVCALTSPARMTTVAAVPVGGAGPTMPRYIYNRQGYVILTEDGAERYYKMGYDWIDVAVAANISRETGYTVGQVLTMTRANPLTPYNVGRRFGVSPEVAFNVADYPFPRVSVYSTTAEERRLKAIEKYQRPGYGMQTTPPQTTSPGMLTTP